MRINLARRENASELILTVMVAAIVSLLGTRLGLEVTNYPRIEHGSWHVAHMLWGGLAMLLGMIFELVFHGEKARGIGAIIFGLGLGWFIDESGKFLSKDNDYFFQPAILVIYVAFISLFFLYRYLEKLGPKNPKSLLYEIFEKMGEVAEGDFEDKEKTWVLERIKLLIQRTNGSLKGFGVGLKTMVEKIPSRKDKEMVWYLRGWKKIKSVGYHKIFKRKVVLIILAIVLAAYVGEGLLSTYRLMINLKGVKWTEMFYGSEIIPSKINIRMLRFKIGTDVVTAILFLLGAGVVMEKKKRRAGIRLFQWGLMVSIFLSSVARFYFEQFSAVFGLGFNVVVYYGLERLKRDL